MQLTSWLIPGPINLSGKWRHLAVVFQSRLRSPGGSLLLLPDSTYDAGADLAWYVSSNAVGMNSLYLTSPLRLGLLLGVNSSHTAPRNLGRHASAGVNPLFGTRLESETGWSSENCAFAVPLMRAADSIAKGVFAYLGLTSNSNSFASTLLNMSGVGLSIKPGSEWEHPGWGDLLVPIPGGLYVLVRWPADGASYPTN